MQLLLLACRGVPRSWQSLGANDVESTASDDSVSWLEALPLAKPAGAGAARHGRESVLARGWRWGAYQLAE